MAYHTPENTGGNSTSEGKRGIRSSLTDKYGQLRMRTKKGTFAKGNPGKPKGAENKLKQEARQLFLETLEGQVPNIQEAFEKVRKENPEKYLDLFAKYAQYFVPKKTENDTTLNLPKPARKYFKDFGNEH